MIPLRSKVVWHPMQGNARRPVGGITNGGNELTGPRACACIPETNYTMLVKAQQGVLNNKQHMQAGWVTPSARAHAGRRQCRMHQHSAQHAASTSMLRMHTRSNAGQTCKAGDTPGCCSSLSLPVNPCGHRSPLRHCTLCALTQALCEQSALWCQGCRIVCGFLHPPVGG